MKIFICDDAPESFFTAVFEAFGEDCVITSDRVQLSLGDETVRVRSDYEKCARVLKALKKYDGYAEKDILTALRSCNGRKEQICFKYIKKLLELKKPIRKAFNLPEVVEMNDIISKITGETHKLTGFLRFKETSDGTFYAPYSPDNDITDMLMPHFAERFKAERFIIHDIKRKVAGLYNGQSWIIAPVGEAEICLSGSERAFEALWKKYYGAVNIESRPHEKQMKGSMPVRYWKFLPEKN